MNGIKNRRIELGMTQREAAEKIQQAGGQCDSVMLSRFERGACLPNAETLEAILTVLQASVSDLYPPEEIAAIEAENAAESEIELPVEIAILLTHIPFGYSKAVSRETLSQKMGVSDREVRRRIESARRFGCVIINHQDGRGYYQSNDVRDWERQYWQDRRRALSILARSKTIRRRLKALGREV